jgi:hypothetical protein
MRSMQMLRSGHRERCSSRRACIGSLSLLCFSERLREVGVWRAGERAKAYLEDLEYDA